MSKRRDRRDFQVGDWWLSRRSGSDNWYRTWYDRESRRTRREAIKDGQGRATDDFDVASRLLTELWLAEQRDPEARPEGTALRAVLLDYYYGHAVMLPSAERSHIAIRRFCEFWPDAMVADIKPRSVQRYHAARLAEGIANDTVNLELSTLSAALNWAVKATTIDQAPFVPMLPPSPPRDRLLTREEIGALYACADPHLRDFILLSIATLGRPGAILEMTTWQGDRARRLIDLKPHGRAQTHKGRALAPMIPSVMPLFHREPGPIVQYAGKPVASIKTTWRRARAAAGLGKDVIPYTLRHTLATELRFAGVPLWDVQGLLGHKGAKTTDRYARFVPDPDGAAARLLETIARDVLRFARQFRASGDEKKELSP